MFFLGLRQRPPCWTSYGIKIRTSALAVVRSPLKGIRHSMAEVDKRRWIVLFKVPLKAPGSCGSCHIPSWGPRNAGVLKSLRGVVCAVLSLLVCSMSGSHQNGDVFSTGVRRVSLALLHISLLLTWPIAPPISIQASQWRNGASYLFSYQLCPEHPVGALMKRSTRVTVWRGKWRNTERSKFYDETQ